MAWEELCKDQEYPQQFNIYILFSFKLDFIKFSITMYFDVHCFLKVVSGDFSPDANYMFFKIKFLCRNEEVPTILPNRFCIFPYSGQ